MHSASRYLSIERVEALAVKALQNGGTLSRWSDDGRPRRQVEWRLAMDCSDPRWVELHSRMSANALAGKPPMSVILSVRCRKCEWCKKMRQRFWMGRAFSEYDCAQRTYMGTFTASIDNHIKIDAVARVRLQMAGVDFDGLNDREKFEARCIEFGTHITLWLKRVRKMGCKFRYLMVAEEHASDVTAAEMRYRPHVHVLIHEKRLGDFYDGTLKVGRSGMFIPDEAPQRQAWYLGHTRFQAADSARTATYLCKYITKEAHVRIRASLYYGDSGEGAPVSCGKAVA